MRIVVTGTSGRIGAAVAAELAADHEVIGVDRMPGPATAVIADIADGTVLPRLLEDAGALVHCAALHAPHVGEFSDAEFRRINVDGTASLAAMCVNAGVPAMVFTSTTALYGGACHRDGQAAWVTEHTVPEPLSIYHRTKLEAEQRLEALASASFRVTVLRMSRCFPERAPMMAVYRLHRGIDARDVATAHRRALNPGGHYFRRFIVSNTTAFQAADVEALKAAAPGVLGQRCPELVAAFSARGWPLPASIDRVYDASLATRELGWQPAFGWQEVLRQCDAGCAAVRPVTAP